MGYLSLTERLACTFQMNTCERRARWPACSELQVERHFTRLSKMNFSIDTNFLPLGFLHYRNKSARRSQSCFIAGFMQRHPLAKVEASQGFLQIMHHLQSYIEEITGMAGVSLTAMAGSQGEFDGVAMIKAITSLVGDTGRDEILIPEAAHGYQSCFCRNVWF